jgi:hypothetical protein
LRLRRGKLDGPSQQQVLRFAQDDNPVRMTIQ